MEAHAALTREVAELREVIERLQAGETVASSTGSGQRVTLGSVLRAAAFFLFAYVIVPIGLLVAAYWVLIIRLDANPMYLRMISLLIPLPFGYTLFTSERQGIWAALVTGTIVGVAAVSGMSTVLGIIDGRPIIPADRREWQELIEYSAGIMLAYVTGNLLGRLGDRVQKAKAAAAAAKASPGGGGGGGAFGGDDGLGRLFRWDMIITALGAIATAGGGVIAALKGQAE